MEFVRDKPSRQRAFDIPEKYTPELFARLQSSLDAADAKIAGADEKYRRRLHFVRWGLDYTKLVVDTQAWMQKLEASKGQHVEVRARLLTNWQTAATMKAEFPDFAINGQAVFREPRPDGDSKRIMGLHPDVPLSGRTLRELRSTGLE